MSEHINEGPALGFSRLLGLAWDSGQDQLPPLWHMLYLVDRPAHTDLGADGQPRRNALVQPASPSTRRMFAGASVTIHQPLLVGDKARRLSQVIREVEKTGSAGALTFVTVYSEIYQQNRLCISEEQTIAFIRRARTSGTETRHHASPSLNRRSFPLDDVLLNRFSALTYNAHRIHWDRSYLEVEGYEDLVVHGPLQGMLMAELFRGDAVRKFTYRLVAPLTVRQGLHVVRSGEHVHVEDDHGRVTARGVAELASQ